MFRPLLRLAVLPLRDIVVYPRMMIPMFVGRAKSIRALERSMIDGNKILLVAQSDAKQEEPSERDLFDVGCEAKILPLHQLPDATVKVTVEGIRRARIVRHFVAGEYF